MFPAETTANRRLKVMVNIILFLFGNFRITFLILWIFLIFNNYEDELIIETPKIDSHHN